MVEKKSIAPELAEAEREMFGPIGEAQALIEIYKVEPDVDSFCLLSVAVLNRLCDRFDTYHAMLVKYGFPTLSERSGD